MCYSYSIPFVYLVGYACVQLEQWLASELLTHVYVRQFNNDCIAGLSNASCQMLGGLAVRSVRVHMDTPSQGATSNTPDRQVYAIVSMPKDMMLACRFMAELGKLVPILPIVTKSDSMTIREAATYRRQVYRKLQNPQLPEPQGHCCHPPPPS